MNINTAAIPQYDRLHIGIALFDAAKADFETPRFMAGFEEWQRSGGADKYQSSGQDAEVKAEGGINDYAI